MDCCKTQNYDGFFDRKTAKKELRKYHKKGPDKSTKLMIGALRKEGIDGMTLLDIGGGVGVIQHELLKDGLRNAVGVDASSAYIDESKEEATRSGNGDKVKYHFGNFVELSTTIDEADIVTLNKVICCYPDMWSLVGLSVVKSTRFYGLIYPRDTWWVKMGVSIANFFLWISRKEFRAFVHPTKTIESMIRRAGLEQSFFKTSNIWQVVVYRRT
jgi:magnesium-protoporphyrin O-methyltransferase